MEAPGQSHVRLFKRPDLNCGARYQHQRGIKGLESSGGQVCVGQFLHDLC